MEHITEQLQEHQNYFDEHLKSNFIYNYKGYNRYIPAARLLFDFKPIYKVEKDKKGDIKEIELRYDKCTVLEPPPQYLKEVYNNLPRRDKLELLIKAKYKHLTIIEEYKMRELNGEQILEDGSNLEDLYNRFNI